MQRKMQHVSSVGIILCMQFVLQCVSATEPAVISGRSLVNIIDEGKEKIVQKVLGNCTRLQNEFGVGREQIERNEPDFSRLRVDFWVGPKTVEYPIVGSASKVLANPAFRRELPLVIFVHGFLNGGHSISVQTVCRSFVSRGGYNVLNLDSSSQIYLLYLRSSAYVRFIGDALGQELAEFHRNGYNPSSIHLVGHSLGSHISGFAGKTFRRLTGRNIGRISALDPAGPCFFSEDPSSRLSRDDADFVDAVHTNGGVFGLIEPTGAVDFYVNNGEEQPGCITSTCSHNRVWELYAESVLSPNNFPAAPCSDWTKFSTGACPVNTGYLGLPASPALRGTFYLKTNRRSPYGLGHGSKHGILSHILGLH